MSAFDDGSGTTSDPGAERWRTAEFSRRTLLSLGGIGIGAGLLAACSGGPTTTGGSSGSASSSSLGGPGGSATGSQEKEGTTATYTGVKPASSIEFWSDHPGGSGPLETALVNEYNQSQSETTVKLVTAGSNYADVAQRFQTALASNRVPALVVVSDAFWFRYALEGQTVPIEPLADLVELNTSDYVKTFYDDYTYKGQHWAVPYARSTPMFYYNKGHFHAAGLPDRAPKSWDEVDEFANKLKSKDLGTQAVFNYATPANYLAWNFENNVWGAGGAYSSRWDLSPIVSSGTISALSAAAKTMQINGGWAGMTSNNQTNDLAAETISMCTDSSGAIGHLTKDAQFTAGAGFMPAGPKRSDHVCPTGGTGIGITSKSGPSQQLAAAKFLAYLTNPKNCIKLALATGYIPVRKSAKTGPLIKKTPMIRVALDQLQHLRSEDYALVFITGGSMTIGNGIGKVLLKNADPKQTMEGVRTQLTTAFDRDIKPKLK